MLIELILIVLSILTICFVELFHYNPPPLFGIYQRKNGFYYLKVALMYLLLSLRKLKKEDETKEKQFYHEIDKPQKLSAHAKAIDAVYLNGANKNGDHLIVGTARRKDKLVDGFMYLKLHSKYGLLETPKLPNTSLYQEIFTEEYSAEGLKLAPVEPMKKWRFTYEGKMKEAQNRNLVHDVKVDALWTTDLPYFNFDKHTDPLCMAKAMSYEKWSRSYFKNLEGNHQTHYEQFGMLKGKVTVDNEEFPLQLDTVRDHSFGFHREWRQFERYVEHFFTTENGDYINVGVICLPVSFSRLIVGHCYSAKYQKLFPVQDCDFQMYQHGSNGSPPLDYAFSFTAGNKNYTVQVLIADCPHFYISQDWETKIYEGLAKFKLNGVAGWGCTEWQYRNIRGKDVEDFTEEKK